MADEIRPIQEADDLFQEIITSDSINGVPREKFSDETLERFDYLKEKTRMAKATQTEIVPATSEAAEIEDQQNSDLNNLGNGENQMTDEEIRAEAEKNQETTSELQMTEPNQENNENGSGGGRGRKKMTEEEKEAARQRRQAEKASGNGTPATAEKPVTHAPRGKDKKPAIINLITELSMLLAHADNISDTDILNLQEKVLNLR